MAAAKDARDPIPAKLPPTRSTQAPAVAVLRAGRRGLQMVLRLLAHNAEHWLASHLNAYLRDDDEYRAITRQTIIRGLAGTITYTPAAITVEPRHARQPRVARALALLIDEINHAPPSHPRRQPAHHLPHRCSGKPLTPTAAGLPEVLYIKPRDMALKDIEHLGIVGPVKLAGPVGTAG